MEDHENCIVPELEDGELIENGTNVTQVKDLRSELGGDCVKENGYEPMDIPNLEENVVLMTAIDGLHDRLRRVETFLNMDGDGKQFGALEACQRSSRRISKDVMLQILVDTINSHEKFGIGRPLIRKILSEKLSVEINESSYYSKKLNSVIKFGLDKNLFTFCRKDALFKKCE